MTLDTRTVLNHVIDNLQQLLVAEADGIRLVGTLDILQDSRRHATLMADTSTGMYGDNMLLAACRLCA